MDRYALLCRTLKEQPRISQRALAKILDVSLGTVNSLIKESLEKNLIYLNESNYYFVLSRGQNLLDEYKVNGAVILAAGFGSRFVPLTYETPKGLLEVFGERMIERQIEQLHEVGIRNITIVVGYLKEKFEYLIDKYQVKLLYNGEYNSKNTLATLYHVRKAMEGRNMYLLSSDNWMRDNMFHLFECGTWYSSVYTEGNSSEWCLSLNKKGLIQDVQIGGHDSWFMYGPAFFRAEWLKNFLPVVEAYYQLPGTEQFYWEQVYMDLLNGAAVKRLEEAGIERVGGIPLEELTPKLFDMYANCQEDTQVYEFENLEELRVFDLRYQTHSDNKALELVSEIFRVPESEIHDIRCLKSGMTNKSFLFQLRGKSYICRIPGTGTELLINRKQEEMVYRTVQEMDITEHIVYFNGVTGYKIAEYYEDSRNADASNWEDVAQCMNVLRQLHQSGFKVNHSFDIRERIGFYETLCKSHGSILFEDYDQVRGWMTEMMDWLDRLERPKCLSHIDSVADNFLFLKDGRIRLIDWEYSGMCDPLIDIAMAAIYSYYNDRDANRLLDVYLERPAQEEERKVYYVYMALGGFLWSLWAVYKGALGEEFGEYTLIMYRYAKSYYQKFLQKS